MTLLLKLFMQYPNRVLSFQEIWSVTKSPTNNAISRAVYVLRQQGYNIERVGKSQGYRYVPRDEELRRNEDRQRNSDDPLGVQLHAGMDGPSQREYG